jgi:hypothetical protein
MTESGQAPNQKKFSFFFLQPVHRFTKFFGKKLLIETDFGQDFFGVFEHGFTY